MFALISGLFFIAGTASILSFISLYVYELPTHHCPFCLLQKEYGRIGYPLYASLFGSALAGTGVGILIPFGRMKSLSDILPGIQKKLAAFSLSLALLFCLIVLFVMMRSTLKLF